MSNCWRLAALMFVIALHFEEARAGELRAGAYAADITPTSFPISINGSMTDQLAKGAHDPLHARCLVLDDGKTRIAIVVCDSCALPRDLLDRAKQLAENQTDIPASRILISATHAHSCPTVVAVFQSEPVASYRDLMIARIAEGIGKAIENLEPAQIGWGADDEPNQVFNRRWHLKAGATVEDPFGGRKDRVQMNPGHGSRIKDRPAGPVDPQVSVLSVQARDGRPIALLANYSLHYVGGVEPATVSSDYYGEFAARLTQKLGAATAQPAFVGMMSNGTSGDANNVNYAEASPRVRKPYEQIQLVANAIAETAAKAVRNAKYQSSVPLAMSETELELEVRRPDPADVALAKKTLAAIEGKPATTLPTIYARETVALAGFPKTVRAKIQAIRIGELAIGSSPCETFAETGLAVKRESPAQRTFVIELANGYNGYLPTPEHHKLGGYETWRARSSYLSVDSEPKIRQAILDQIRTLWASL